VAERSEAGRIVFQPFGIGLGRRFVPDNPSVSSADSSLYTREPMEPLRLHKEAYGIVQTVALAQGSLWMVLTVTLAQGSLGRQFKALLVQRRVAERSEVGRIVSLPFALCITAGSCVTIPQSASLTAP